MNRWILAARPATLTAAIVPVAVGTACAYTAGSLRWGPALAALFGAIWIQIGTNFANDVFDAEKGADGDDRLGPTRAVAAGLIDAGAMRRAMILSFGLATLAGAYLTYVAGWPVVVIGVVSVLSGVAYTGGPFPLGYHGLGDLFVMLFFGFVAVAGTAYVQVGAVPLVAIWAAVPVGALATVVLVVNNLRDRETDLRAGKRTLAVRFGRRAAIAEYAGLVLVSYAVPVGLWVTGPWTAAVLLPLVTLPMAIVLVRRVASRTGRELNLVLASTARLLLVHGLSWAAGLILAAG